MVEELRRRREGYRIRPTSFCTPNLEKVFGDLVDLRMALHRFQLTGQPLKMTGFFTGTVSGQDLPKCIELTEQALQRVTRLAVNSPDAEVINCGRIFLEDVLQAEGGDSNQAPGLPPHTPS